MYTTFLNAILNDVSGVIFIQLFWQCSACMYIISFKQSGNTDHIKSFHIVVVRWLYIKGYDWAP